MTTSLRLVALALGTSVALAQLPAARALDPNSIDPRSIMQAASDQTTGKSALSRMKMTIRQGVSVRERLMTVRALRADDSRKALILIEAPEDVRNTGFLTVDYRTASRNDEQWLYLPALHRVSRVPNSGKSDAFVGSDFSISDLSGQDPSDYELVLLEASSKLGDDECWLIESRPRNEEVLEKTGYTKAHIWVSKEKQLVVQFKAWTDDPNRTKYFKATEIRKVDGLWTPHRLQMRTLTQGAAPSETVIDVLNVRNETPEVTEADFTQQRLERGL